MEKPVFMTFGAGRFQKSKFRLINQVLKTNWFSKIVCLDDIFLSTNSIFKPNDKSLRGHGYYKWKSYCVYQTLLSLEENQILLYLDAGFTINSFAEKRFNEYLDILKDEQTFFLGFQVGFLEKNWTKRDLLILMNSDRPEITDSPQIMSGIHFWKNNDFTRNLAAEWFRISKNDNAINDDASINSNYTGFKEHRHDQSILSILVKNQKEHCKFLSDETYHSDFNSDEAKNLLPFFATRYDDNNINYLEWVNK